MDTKNNQKKVYPVWEYVKIALRLKGLSISALARKHGVTRATILYVKKRPCPKYEKTLADAVGARPEDMWPDRYGEDGLPIGISSIYRPKEFGEERSRQFSGCKRKNKRRIRELKKGD